MLDCDGTVVRDTEDKLAQAGAERAMNRRLGMFERLGAALAAFFTPTPTPAMIDEAGTGKSN